MCSRAVRQQPGQSHQSQIVSVVQAARPRSAKAVRIVLDKASGF
jgi:hypothetical protein